MGTRAAFWIGDPRDIAHREWLGGLAWQGYPGGIAAELVHVTSAEDFRTAIDRLFRHQQAFTDPQKGWPFPWTHDVFLTDYTYAWIDGTMMVTSFHAGFRPLDEVIHSEETCWRGDGEDGEIYDELPSNVSAPSPYNAFQPDSIMIINDDFEADDLGWS